MLRRKVAQDGAGQGGAQDSAATVAMEPSPSPAVSQEFGIVLSPISHPDLGDIRIDENLFAIGRTEAPFDSYPPGLTADLSRRHARIFSEYGVVYIADLGSKNGTNVNGVNIRQKTSRLQDGDEICFGGALSYRVHLGARVQAPQRREAKLQSLTLAPEHGEFGLQPIVISQFPFLVSKADATFSRYKGEYPHQVNYISRRHAHIFLKGGQPFVEDLGSTNGTFVGDKRLEEHAVPLKDGDVIAFGGHHFVYKVGLQTQEAELDPTITKLSKAVRMGAAQPADVEKTTFVESADSFLDIFCVDHAQQQEDELNKEEHAEAAPADGERKRPRGRVAIFFTELMQAFAGGEGDSMKRAARWGGAFVALLALFAAVLYLREATEGALKDMVADGEYVRAAAVADRSLQRDPENAEVRALGTEALLKAYVPKWLALLNAHDFAGASDEMERMKKLGSHNADVLPLLDKLAWIGNLEQFVAGRGGTEAPIRIYADEERIKALVKGWDDDTSGYQRAFATIASYVPQFRDPYAQALSHLRKLQSDDAVYLTAIGRLKSTIATELNQDRPDTLEAVLNEYAEKYPRIGGLDAVRQDLRRYTQIVNEAREQDLGPLVSHLSKAQFLTPPFREKFRALQTGRLLPPNDVMQQYQEVAKAWRAGDPQQAFDGLQKMTSGPWGEAAAKELRRKQDIVQRYAALQKSRDAAGYEDRLLAFYGPLDADEDAYFVQAVQPDIGRVKEKALGQAQELLSRAQAKWNQYRQNGALQGAHRLESSISKTFRTQAGFLTGAQADANRGMQIYTELKAERPAQWSKLQEEINAEARAQRQALEDLRHVLEPGLWKAKLALLGGTGNGERQPAKTAD